MLDSHPYEHANSKNQDSSTGIRLRVSRVKGDGRLLYERGLTELDKCFKAIGGKDLEEFQDYRQQLLANLLEEHRFGGDSGLTRERNRISSRLNQLALRVMGESFNDFALGNLKCITTADSNPETRPIDFAIITALEKETKAVVSRLNDHSIFRFEDKDIRTYHYGTVPISLSDQLYHVVVVTLTNMGNVPAANAATDTLVRWNPRFVLMVGIAGGIPKDNLDLGDVVVAKQVVGYEYSKVTDAGAAPRDHVYPVSALLLERIRNFWDDTWTRQIGVARPANARRAASKQFVGPIASGNKVVASTEFRRQLTERWPELLAVETESEGVFAAVSERPQVTNTLVIRGICDMADERKSDEWQEYAAHAAAAFTVGFLSSGPVEVAI